MPTRRQCLEPGSTGDEAIKAGDVVRIELADLVLRHDSLQDQDTWQPSGRVIQIPVGPLKPGG